MKKTNLLKLLSVLVILVMAMSLFAGCKKETEEPAEKPSDTQEVSSGDTQEQPQEVVEEPKSMTPLVAGYNNFSEKFSPFFADTGYDQDAVGMTQVGLLTTDRQGGIIYNAIEGETVPYNGTDYLYTGIANIEVNYDEAKDITVYTWTIRDDVKFSDGELLTADDVIFSYYVLSDPSYDGSSTLYSAPILGMQDYRTQTSSEVYVKYGDMFDAIYAAGQEGAPDTWTQEQADVVWTLVDSLWREDLQLIIDYCVETYPGYFADYLGFTAEEVEKNDGLKVAAGIVFWGFGEVDIESKVLMTYETETSYDMANGQYPTFDDFYNETIVKYGDFASYAPIESPQDVSPFDTAKETFIMQEGPKDETLAGKGIPNIAGIKKLSDTQIEVTLKGFDATAIYKLGVSVAPLHYYGDEAMYDYANNKFGFPFGDLSIVKAKTTMPMGAGPYRFIKYENKVIYFEANENYYRGEPRTYYLQFKETADADKIPGVSTGTIDVTDPSFGNAAVQEIKSYNSNGEITGSVITTNQVDNLE